MAQKYEELHEEFLDAVFGIESIVGRKEWISIVKNKLAYVVDPIKIRKMMKIPCKWKHFN